jgi:dipeptidyl aminopeptidase/acylaminoacyl peptidase
MTDSAPELTAELTAELIVDGAVPAQPVVSPDGRWVAYAVAPTGKRGEHRLSAIWIAAADASSPPRQLTAGTAADSAPRWAPDSAALFFVSDRTGSAQLHRIRLDGGEAEALTAWRSGIDGHYPLAGGRVVAVLAADEPTQEDERRKADRDDAVVWGEQVPWRRLRLLDLETGELRVVDGIGDRHVVELAQRPDGGPLAVLSWGSPDIDPGVRTIRLHLANPETAAVRDLGPAGLEAQSPAWWHDGGSWHLAYLAEPRLLGGMAVYDASLPAAGGAGEHRNLTEGMPVCPAELAQVPGGPLLALFADGLDTGIYRLDPGARRFRRLAAMDGMAGSLTVSTSGAVAAVLASTAHEPRDVHAGSPDGRFSATPGLPCARSGGGHRNACPIRHPTGSASTGC